MQFFQTAAKSSPAFFLILVRIICGALSAPSDGSLARAFRTRAATARLDTSAHYLRRSLGAVRSNLPTCRPKPRSPCVRAPPQSRCARRYPPGESRTSSCGDATAAPPSSTLRRRRPWSTRARGWTCARCTARSGCGLKAKFRAESANPDRNLRLRNQDARKRQTDFDAGSTYPDLNLRPRIISKGHRAPSSILSPRIAI